MKVSTERDHIDFSFADDRLRALAVKAAGGDHGPAEDRLYGCDRRVVVDERMAFDVICLSTRPRCRSAVRRQELRSVAQPRRAPIRGSFFRRRWARQALADHNLLLGT
jgi:hypothetical protein